MSFIFSETREWTDEEWDYYCVDISGCTLQDFGKVFHIPRELLEGSVDEATARATMAAAEKENEIVWKALGWKK